MWITAWLMVVSAALNQPNLPPFATEADCEAARKVYTKRTGDGVAQCVQAKVFVYAQR